MIDHFYGYKVVQRHGTGLYSRMAPGLYMGRAAASTAPQGPRLIPRAWITTENVPGFHVYDLRTDLNTIICADRGALRYLHISTAELWLAELRGTICAGLATMSCHAPSCRLLRRIGPYPQAQRFNTFYKHNLRFEDCCVTAIRISGKWFDTPQFEHQL